VAAAVDTVRRQPAVAGRLCGGGWLVINFGGGTLETLYGVLAVMRLAATIALVVLIWRGAPWPRRDGEIGRGWSS
jgi:hypothetical protein